MRGGTSRGLFFRQEDLPPDPHLRDRLLVAAVGGPDPRQVDGLGGADLLLSKIAILGPSERPAVDLEVTFASAAPGRTRPAYGANCGNLIAAAALYAVEEHMVWPQRGRWIVRIYDTDSEMIVEGRLGADPPDRDEICRLAGMPASGQWVDLDFLAPSGAVQDRFWPTGNACDRVKLEDGTRLDMSLIDCGTLYAFVPAAQLGLETERITISVQNDAATMKLFETIRGHAAVLAGLVKNPADALTDSPAVPKLALVGPAASYRLEGAGPGQATTVQAGAMDLTSRIISTQKYHQAYAVTGAIATAAAAAVEGSVVAQAAGARCRGEADGWSTLRIGHPSGVIAASVHVADNATGVIVDRARIGRTARTLMTGTILVPGDAPIPVAQTPAAVEA
jgi:hypothetical protein